MTSTDVPVVWVTGASRGIGLAVATAFASIGARVALSGRDRARLLQNAKALRAQGEEAIGLTCDVRSEKSVARAYRRICDQLGSVDVLVNNAGVTYFTSFAATTIDQFDHLLETNLRGAFLCTQQVLPAMLARGRGHIFNVASVAATTTFLNSSVYAASKAGLLAMSRGLRAEVRMKGIRVIDVLPGAVETDIWSGGVKSKFGDKMMRPDDVGDVLVSLYCQPERLTTDEITIRPVEGDLG
jgi:NADP-dependent 3-hydroxy acid dehydrogenase YdfG